LGDIQWEIKILSNKTCFVPRAVETFWKRENGIVSPTHLLQGNVTFVVPVANSDKHFEPAASGWR
jgi:hypothetical protein